jgi:hypothetical protein
MPSFALFVSVLLTSLTLHASPDTPKGRNFGSGLKLISFTKLAEILEQPDRYTESPVLVEGRITDLCMKKGCWTVLTEGESVLRVRFHDYGFFLPQDAMGARVFVEGVAEVRTLSEKEARHHASESRDGDPDSIEGPQREISFVATGVRLLPE